ncbi:MAG: SpoIIE family protein phosphatase, partial [Bacteroidetes bacterium]|nr:SpoIIE family protein phosphatase [Bacteroidota bacterium]
LMFAAAGSTLMIRPLESGFVTTILFWLAVLAAIINAFRLPWIVYLSKREKIFGLIYSLLLFLCFTWIDILFLQGSMVDQSLLYYSYPLREIVQLTTIGANIYFGMAFVTTLFHLPTADAFERKRSEVTSLSTLSKLVTQALDFKELVDTVTSMTMEVCEASSCWLEIIYSTEEETPLGPTGAKRVRPAADPSYLVQVAGTRKISQEEIDELVPTRVRSLRDDVIKDRKSITVDDIGADSRVTAKGSGRRHGGSIAVVPLMSHVGLIGILYATKETSYGFGKEDLEMISAFADQASVALENSRLVKKSIERERLLREMLVAQEMQRRLLPQEVPASPALELDAVSTPAFEVGGDYYDFMQIDPKTIGIVVGDVSGKGVSAAFYMSEVKGIFQSLGRMYTSPREFMMKANEALASSIDKRSFVSLIYALVDTHTGKLTLSRAGHCPMLHVFDGGVRYVRPNGIGLGLTQGELFDTAIEEESIQLSVGDVCLFYTDGLTEARHGNDEFGYERLKGLTQRIRSKPASAIKHEIIESVKDFIEDQVAHDDLTVVVLKWHGNGTTKSSQISNVEEAQ